MERSTDEKAGENTPWNCFRKVFDRIAYYKKFAVILNTFDEESDKRSTLKVWEHCSYLLI